MPDGERGCSLVCSLDWMRIESSIGPSDMPAMSEEDVDFLAVLLNTILGSTDRSRIVTSRREGFPLQHTRGFSSAAECEPNNLVETYSTL